MSIWSNPYCDFRTPFQNPANFSIPPTDELCYIVPMATAHEVDYKIFGDDMQFVEVELDPEEAAVAEAGGMMYMDDGIEMETIFGDGSNRARAASWAP